MFILYITSRYSHFNIAKGNMSFCHHLVYVVCHPFTFHILIFSSENPQPNELKLDRKHLWKFTLKSAHFVMIHYQTWPPQEILVSDWPIFKNLLL